MRRMAIVESMAGIISTPSRTYIEPLYQVDFERYHFEVGWGALAKTFTRGENVRAGKPHALFQKGTFADQTVQPAPLLDAARSSQTVTTFSSSTLCPNLRALSETCMLNPTSR